MSITKNEIKVSFHQIYQCVFKPITFTESIENLDKKSKIKLLFKLSFYSLIISIVIDTLIGTIISYLGYKFDWIGLLLFISFGIALGIAWGIGWGIGWGIAVGIGWGIAGGIAGGIALGITGGIAVDVALGIAGGIIGGITVGVAVGIAGIIAGGIGWGIAVGIALGITVGIAGGIAGSIAFIASYFRVFYIFPQLVQYWRFKIFGHEPFSLFRNSPIYWDEVIVMPLPFLTNFLVSLVNINRNEGLKEVEFVSSKRPTQRKAAFSALLEITIQDLSRFKTIEEIAEVSNNLSFISAFRSSLSEEFSSAVRNIEEISIDAKSYLDSTSDYNKLKNLNVLADDIDKLKKTLIATKGPVGYKFHSVAEKWLQIIKEENNKFICLKKDTFQEISNPYIFGNPVRPEDKSRLFVGRKDIIREIESNLSNISQKPTLFLYGRRRVGKSSVLINLPGHLGKQYASAYIDCQDARARESPASFCYSLSRSIYNSLGDRSVSSKHLPFESFQKNPFTVLGGWFDEIEKTLGAENMLVLITFDEYEKLEESILTGALSVEVLDQLRNIIQHRRHFVVLIAGSRELNELKLNWSDYLISAKTIKLGYLSEDDARILITNPIDDFSLNYEGGEKGEVVNKIINVTSCQPYLVQALCFELVNYLNSQCRRVAGLEDVDIAIEKVLVSAENYFYYIWNSECSENEKKYLKRLINNLPIDGDEKEINSLVKKEIIEKADEGYKFKVELMKKWIEKNNSGF
ncbi:putative transporter component [Candidatus Methanoperedens nitroreducens]|uniref:Putative transporter component n=1 Tax=Candidatus Methanoperedens nitratireducens TaxID=1392998 RepID=A0A062UZT9_9EURY|nr:AAA family ATPase [Candidatus Methanoperedens nitroreducens]KCZ72416.1 putative transporter component [Candidatus Methanoperedens nitroreducens]MDJ1423650.1 AAA family ATPase [Candidatus Methanoperedens sp.]